jgi:hypothetical protein
VLFIERPITVAHVRDFARFNEGLRVEYKRDFDANVREKLPKVITSFANSHGGVLVVGVNTLNGVPQGPFEGFEPPAREEFALTVENICLQNIYPPVLPRTTVVPSDVGNRVFLVIEVEESGEAPHAIENSKKVYVRTGNAGKRTAQTDGVQEETAEPETCYAFRFRAYWFVLTQTEGEDTPIPAIPGFDVDTALCALNITRMPFDELNGNII